MHVWLAIILSISFVHAEIVSYVTRKGSEGDEFQNRNGERNCETFKNSRCVRGTCPACECYWGLTFYQGVCTRSPQLACSLHFTTNSGPNQPIRTVNNERFIRNRAIGVIALPRKCRLTENCMYSDTEQWRELFTEGRQKSDFQFEKTSQDKYAIKLAPAIDLNLYKGMLVKLQFKCAGVAGERSCAMFKVTGTRKYTSAPPTVLPKVLTTLIYRLTTPTTAQQTTNNDNTKTILVVVIIVISVLVLIAIMVVIFMLWKRKRSKKKENLPSFERKDKNNQSQLRLLKNEAIYQEPDITSSSRSLNSTDGKQYLQPVDSVKTNNNETGPYEDPDQFVRGVQKKEGNFDYKSNKKVKSEGNLPVLTCTPPTEKKKHVYAACSDNKISHAYMDPDLPPPRASKNHNYDDPQQFLAQRDPRVNNSTHSRGDNSRARSLDHLNDVSNEAYASLILCEVSPQFKRKVLPTQSNNPVNKSEYAPYTHGSLKKASSSNRNSSHGEYPAFSMKDRPSSSEHSSTSSIAKNNQPPPGYASLTDGQFPPFSLKNGASSSHTSSAVSLAAKNNTSAPGYAPLNDAPPAGYAPLLNNNAPPPIPPPRYASLNDAPAANNAALLNNSEIESRDGGYTPLTQDGVRDAQQNSYTRAKSHYYEVEENESESADGTKTNQPPYFELEKRRESRNIRDPDNPGYWKVEG